MILGPQKMDRPAPKWNKPMTPREVPPFIEVDGAKYATRIVQKDKKVDWIKKGWTEYSALPDTDFFIFLNPVPFEDKKPKPKEKVKPKKKSK